MKEKITEEKWFHTSSDYSFESLVTPDDLKEDKSFEIFSSIYPDLVLVYGTGLIGTKLSNLGKIEALTFMADFHHGIEVRLNTLAIIFFRTTIYWCNNSFSCKKN